MLRCLIPLIATTLVVAADGHGHHQGTPIGTATIGSTTVAVAAVGQPQTGTAWPVSAETSGVQPRALRLWVGTADGRGSAKARAHAHGDDWHAEVEIPDPLPTGSRLWISVESTSGRTMESLPLPAAAP